MDQRPLLGGETVEQRRFAGVGAADQRQSDERRLRRRGRVRRAWQRGHDGIAELDDATTVLGGDGEHLVGAQLIELAGIGLELGAVDLVGHP